MLVLAASWLDRENDQITGLPIVPNPVYDGIACAFRHEDAQPSLVDMLAGVPDNVLLEDMPSRRRQLVPEAHVAEPPQPALPCDLPFGFLVPNDDGSRRALFLFALVGSDKLFVKTRRLVWFPILGLDTLPHGDSPILARYSGGLVAQLFFCVRDARFALHVDHVSMVRSAKAFGDL